MDLIPTAAVGALSAAPALVKGLAVAVAAVASQLFRLVGFVSSNLFAYAVAIASTCRTVVVWPINLLAAIAFVIFSPIIYTVAYTIAPIWYLVAIVPRLEPLYIFFGTAAFIGIVAGISVKASSHVFLTAMQLDKEDEDRPEPNLVRRTSSASSATSSMPSSAMTPGVKREDDYFMNGGVGIGTPTEIDWQVIDRVPHHSEHMRRMPLLQSIILEEEEDDSSVGGY